MNEALDGGYLHDDGVVVEDAIYVGIIGREVGEDGFEFGLEVFELGIDGAGRIELVALDGGKQDGIDFFWWAVWFEVGFEEGGGGVGSLRVGTPAAAGKLRR